MKNTETNHTTLTITTAEGLYDLTMLEEMDDTEYLLEVLTLLLQEAPKDLTEMKDVLRSGNIDMVCKKAHKLKSSAGIIQAERLTALLEDIETLGKKGAAVSELALLVENAAAEYIRVEKQLSVYVSQLK